MSKDEKLMSRHRKTSPSAISKSPQMICHYLPDAEHELWNAHPKVMIPLNHGGEARCPYCGTLYRFTGELPRATIDHASLRPQCTRY